MMLDLIEKSKRKQIFGYSFFPDLNSKLINPLFYIRTIIGDGDRFTVDNRLFNSLCIATISSCLVTFYWNNSIGIVPFLNIIMGIFLIYYSVLYYFSRFKRTFNSWYFVIPALIALSLSGLLLKALEGQLQ